MLSHLGFVSSEVKCCSPQVGPDAKGKNGENCEDTGSHLLSTDVDDETEAASIAQVLSTLAVVGSSNESKAASGSELDWLNFVTDVTWPYARKLIIRKGTTIMLETIARKTEELKDVRLCETSIQFDPGSVPPTLKSLRTYRKRHSSSEVNCEGLQFDFDFTWHAGAEFLLKPKLKGVGPAGVPIDVKDLGCSGVRVEGTASAVIAPLMPYEPLFGDLQVFFFDPPNLKMKLIGLSGLGVIGRLLKRMMKKSILSVVADLVVLPNRLLLKARHDVAVGMLTHMTSPLPLGVIEIDILAGKDLIASDSSITGKATSDPYVIIRIGNCMARTSTTTTTCNPQWHDGPNYLLVYDVTQMVRIDVFDDDVLTDDDLIGFLPGFNVYWLCTDAVAPGGTWFELSHPEGSNKGAGSLLLRARFLDVQTLGAMISTAISEAAPPTESGQVIKPAQTSLPRLLTVTLLGLEGEDARHLGQAQATIEWLPRASSDNRVTHECDGEAADVAQTSTSHSVAGKVNSNASRGSSLFSMIPSVAVRSGVQAVSGIARIASKKVQSVTGLGYGKRCMGIENSRRSQKAQSWSLIRGAGTERLMDLSPQVVRIIDQLHNREGWTLERIATMVGFDEETVELASSLRTNFSVVWHEAFHFLQAAGTPVYDGKVRITVRKQLGKAAAGLGALGLVTKEGLVGAVQLDLSHAPYGNDSSWCRRVRARLRREGANGVDELPSIESLVGEGQCDPSVGAPLPGVLLEFLVEIRALTPERVERRLEEGQSPGDKKHLTARYWRVNSLGLAMDSRESRSSDK